MKLKDYTEKNKKVENKLKTHRHIYVSSDFLLLRKTAESLPKFFYSDTTGSYFNSDKIDLNKQIP